MEDVVGLHGLEVTEDEGGGGGEGDGKVGEVMEELVPYPERCVRARYDDK